MDNSDKFELAKAVTKFVVGTSVGTVVSRAIKTHVPAKNLGEELQILIGAYALAGMVSDHALDWADAKYEDTRNKLLEFGKSRKERAETE